MKKNESIMARFPRVLMPFRRRKPAEDSASLPTFAVPATAIRALPDAASFRGELLRLIGSAQRRIHIAALYLQDDEAGREIMAALYAAKARAPELEIHLFVDWHRAQRGLIGKTKSEGNAGMYRALAEQFGAGITIYGVPIQNREIFGVLHLKGFIIDDSVLYSGASINDIYLAKQGRYRLDRYHVLHHKPLADCMSAYLRTVFIDSPAVKVLNGDRPPATRELLPAIKQFRQTLQNAQYQFESEQLAPGDVGVTPLVGFGRSNNPLNQQILDCVRVAEQRITVLTPYFNLPGTLRKLLAERLKQGCRIDIVVGDKTANDFFIPPSEPFTTIGLLPYLYEANLRRFAKSYQRFIEDGSLNIFLWKHENNSYHAKGLFIDNTLSVMTGNNLNPRAFTLDLENALFFHDPEQLIENQNQAELAAILRQSERISHYRQLETAKTYPEAVKKKLKRLSRIRLDRVLNRIL